MLPTKLEINDFMSYREATLEFDFNSALLSGANGSGKSAIFNAIAFALFGETRHKNADGVVRRGQQNCRVALYFSHDGKNYRVIRTRNVKYSKMEVEFDEVVGPGLYSTLSHDTNKATDAEIRKVLRTNHEVFINSSYFRQNSFFDFVQGTFGTRQAIIGSLLNLDKWGRYQKAAKTNLDSLEEKTRALKADLERLGDLPTKLKQVSEQIDTSKQKLEALGHEELANTEQLTLLESKLNETKDEAAEYARYQDLVAKIDSQRRAVEKSKSIIDDRVELSRRLQAEIEAGKESVARLAGEMARISERLSNRPTADVAKIEESVVGARSEVRVLTQQIQHLLESNNCQMCGHEWADEAGKNEFLASLKAKREPLEEKLKRAEPKLAAIKAQMEEAKQDDILLEKRRLQKIATEKTAEVASAKRQTIEREIEQLKEQLSVLTQQFIDSENLLQTSKMASQSVDFKALTLQIEEGKWRQQKIKKAIADENFRLGALANEQKTLSSKISDSERLSAQIAELNRKTTMYAQLARAFSKDGIQAIIIDNIVEELASVSNYWLHQFSNEPVHINFVTQKRNTKGDWRETFDIEIHTPTGTAQWEDFSGGEQFRIGFAIRLAFSTIQAKRMGGEVQLLMLDEVSTSLDTNGLEAFVAIIRRLEKEMKVMVITHDDKLKEEFDSIITVSRNLDGSFLS